MKKLNPSARAWEIFLSFATKDERVRLEDLMEQCVGLAEDEAKAEKALKDAEKDNK